MLGELLSVVRLAWDKAPEVKRAASAKALLALHRDVNELVIRGHRILDACEGNGDAESIRMLTEQLGILQRISEAFSREPIARLVDVFLPVHSAQFPYQFGIKSQRVWVRLNALVGGQDLPPEEWLSRLEERGWIWPDMRSEFMFDTLNEPQSRYVRFRRAHFDELGYQLEPEALPGDIAEGRKLLNQLQAASDAFRQLIVDKFKVEDLL